MNHLIEPFGLALLHFLWQGTVLGVALAIALLCVRKGDPRLRYALCCGTLVMMALCPLGTLVALRPPLSDETVSVAPPVMHHPVVYVVRAEPAAPPQGFQAYLPGVVALWVCGVLVLSARTAGGLWLVERLRRKWSREAPAEWQRRFDDLRDQLGIARTVSLRISDRVTIPSTVGVFRAAVILPASLILKFSPEQVETLILHELAHVRRHDYLVNLLQTCVETALFYHPAVWWVSHMARLEREHCCDEIVIRSTGDTGLYARTLAELEHQLHPLPNLSMSARGGHLMQRLARIVSTKPVYTRPISVWPSLLVVAALAVGTAEVVHAESDHPKPPAAKAHKAPKTKASGPVRALVIHPNVKRDPASAAARVIAVAPDVMYVTSQMPILPKGTHVRLAVDPSLAQTVHVNVTAAAPKDITLQLEGVPIGVALARVAKQIGFSYSVAPPSPMQHFGYHEVEANLVHQSLDQALRSICYSAGASFRRDENGTYFISLRSPADPFTEVPALSLGGDVRRPGGFGGASIAGVTNGFGAAPKTFGNASGTTQLFGSKIGGGGLVPSAATPLGVPSIPYTMSVQSSGPKTLSLYVRPPSVDEFRLGIRPALTAPSATVEFSKENGLYRVHIVGASVTQAAETVSNIAKCSIVVEPSATSNTVDVTVSAVSLEMAIDCICRSSGNTYTLKDGVYLITRKR